MSLRERAVSVQLEAEARVAHLRVRHRAHRERDPVPDLALLDGQQSRRLPIVPLLPDALLLGECDGRVVAHDEQEVVAYGAVLAVVSRRIDSDRQRFIQVSASGVQIVRRAGRVEVQLTATCGQRSPIIASVLILGTEHPGRAVIRSRALVLLREVRAGGQGCVRLVVL